MNQRTLFITLLCVMLVILSANATKIIYEDNTFLHNLICCNATDCITIRDVSYIDNNTIYEFNKEEISGALICYEAGNKFDSNISDIALSFPKTIVIIVFIFVGILFFLYALFKVVRGKKQ